MFCTRVPLYKTVKAIRHFGFLFYNEFVLMSVNVWQFSTIYQNLIHSIKIFQNFSFHIYRTPVKMSHFLRSVKFWQFQNKCQRQVTLYRIFTIKILALQKYEYSICSAKVCNRKQLVYVKYVKNYTSLYFVGF